MCVCVCVCVCIVLDSGGVDSTYEYFLKNYLQSGDLRSKALYDTYSKRIIETMYKSSAQGDYHFVSSSNTWDHLACYIGGQFILDRENLEIGLNITDTCARMYVENPNGISCETVRFKTFGSPTRYEQAQYYHDQVKTGTADSRQRLSAHSPVEQATHRDALIARYTHEESRTDKIEHGFIPSAGGDMTCVQDKWFQRPVRSNARVSSSPTV